MTWQVKIPTLVIHGDLDEAGDGSNDAAMDGQQSLVSICLRLYAFVSIANAPQLHSQIYPHLWSIIHWQYQFLSHGQVPETQPHLIYHASNICADEPH